MNCLLCGSTNIETIDTVVSDFVMARISDSFKLGNNYKTKLCFCKSCTFAYYDYRLNSEEELKLYKNYRDEEYQKLRESYECWYTKKINQIINSDNIALNEQKMQIKSMLFANTNQEIRIALDYGGNQGKSFSKEIGTERKFLYDISGIEPVNGVQTISKQQDLKKYNFDFVMCNMLFEHLSDPNATMKEFINLGDESTLFYIEVPDENPFIRGNKFSLLKNVNLIVNPNYSFIRLLKYYFKTSRDSFMPMKEHINFFTKKSLKHMIEVNGFELVDANALVRRSLLGKSKVLSVLFRKNVY